MFFEALLTHIGKLGLDLAAHLPEGVFGDADPTGLGDAFEPGGDVDTVAENVVTLDQDIAEMDADAPFHAAVDRGPGIPLRRQPLQPQGALDGTDHRAKLDEEPVADGLDYPPAMLRDDWIGSGAMLAQGRHRARFIEPHQPAVADHIGRKDGG